MLLFKRKQKVPAIDLKETKARQETVKKAIEVTHESTEKIDRVTSLLKANGFGMIIAVGMGADRHAD